MLDVGPVNVFEAKRQIATRARVVYDAGKLYIVRSKTNIAVHETDTPVATKAETWTAGPFTFTTRGCPTCGWSLRTIPLATILEAS